MQPSNDGQRVLRGGCAEDKARTKITEEVLNGCHHMIELYCLLSACNHDEL